ncbi:MAG: outer membrane beta-barrel protein [Rhodothermales bacterium]
MLSRRLSTFAVALLLAAAASLPAQAQFVLFGGLNFESFEDIQVNNVDVSYDQSTGFHLGLQFNLGLGPVAIRPGIFYRDVGTIEGFDVAQVAFGNARPFDSFSLSYIDVPIDLRFRFGTPMLKPYIFGGPILSFPQADGVSEDRFETFNLAGSVGVGLEVSAPGFGWTLYPELRYGLNLTKLTDNDIAVGGRTFQSQDYNVIMVSLGIGL